MVKLTVVVLALSVSIQAHSKEVKLASPKERIEYIRRADVWLAPSWISSDFKFADDLDVALGAEPKETDKLLVTERIFCRQNEEQAEKEYSGMTHKFYCDLQFYNYDYKNYEPVIKANGKVREIKVKYQEGNREIPSELIGTRLLWALGFAADRMFAVDTVYCFNCTYDPFKIRGLDPLSMINPRPFQNVAVESKFKGEDIEITEENTNEVAFIEADRARTKEGFSFHELDLLSKDKSKRRQQRTHRDAFMLLAVFLQYSDNKSENQRLVCTGKVSDDGKCVGQTVMMLQDVGVAFGEGRESNLKMSKFDFEGWAKEPIWQDVEKCRAKLGMNFDFINTYHPSITEDGRVFLAKLLDGFSSGSVGRERVRQLFRVGHADRYGATIEQWTDVFMQKVEQIKYPMGRANPDFKCPRRAK